MDKIEDRLVVVEALVGSHNYNLNTYESDEDWKYFVAPSFSDLYYGKMFSTGVQSTLYDYTAHDVRQLGSLLWKANINFLEVLYSTNTTYNISLAFLFDNAERWSWMNLPTFKNATYGTHLQKMEGLFKGTSTTAELVEKFGYDTKQACHALRCLYVLERFPKFGDLGKALWFGNDELERHILLSIKAGEYSLGEFYTLVAEWHEKKDKVMGFYDAHKADEESKNELEEQMFSFIKDNVSEE